MKRAVLVCLAVLVAGCARETAPAVANRVCAEQGHQSGTPAFHACWNAVYPAIVADRSRRAAAIIAAP